MIIPKNVSGPVLKHNLELPKLKVMRLFTANELEHLALPDRQYAEDTVLWLQNFLAKPHRHLGRTGPVCPFVPKALQLDVIRLAVIRTQSLALEEIEGLIRGFRDVFLTLEPRTGDLAFYKALLLIFPDVDEQEASDTIDVIQRSLKPLFVQQGLMIGEFHNLNNSPGLHNPDFRPLRSPIPMLAIRFMADSDLPFLNRLTDDIGLRVQYLQSYINQMSKIGGNPQQLTRAQTMLQSLLVTSQDGALGIPSQSSVTSRKQSKCPFSFMLRQFESWKDRGWSLLRS